MEITKDPIGPVEYTLQYDDLTSIQISVLRSISDKRLNIHAASEQTLLAISDLQDQFLITHDLHLYPYGYKAIQLAKIFGGKDRRDAAARRSRKLVNIQKVADIPVNITDITGEPDDFLSYDEYTFSEQH